MIAVRPWYFLLALLLPPLFYFRHLRKPKDAIPLTLGPWLGPRFRTGAPLFTSIYILASACFWAGALLLVVSSAGPSSVFVEKEFLTKGYDILIVLDESPSMGAKDFGGEQRFETAKNLIRSFVSSRENDSVGLVTFGREAALRVPPTLDYAYLEHVVTGLTLGNLGDGTAIGTGVALALSHLRTCGGSRKIIVLLTDGEHNAGQIDPETAALAAKSLSVTLYTIGIGSRGRVPLEYTDPESGMHYSGIFESDFDEAILSAMADLTGGEYNRAPDLPSLKAAFRSVSRREPSASEFRIKTGTRSKHRFFMALALGLLIIDLLTRKFLLKEQSW